MCEVSKRNLRSIARQAPFGLSLGVLGFALSGFAYASTPITLYLYFIISNVIIIINSYIDRIDIIQKEKHYCY